MTRSVLKSEFIADGITPIAAYASATASRPGPSFLLESSPGPRQTSRFSIIGLGATGEIRATDGKVTTRAGEEIERYAPGDVFAAARALMRKLAPEPGGGGSWSRFLGAYGAAAFEFAGYLERLPRLPRADDPMPDLHLIVPETVIVFDHFTHRVAVLTLPDVDGHRDDADLREALATAAIAPVAQAQPLRLPRAR